MVAMLDDDIDWKSLVLQPERIDERLNIVLAFSLPTLQKLDVYVADGQYWGEAQHCGSDGFQQVMEAYKQFLEAKHAAINPSLRFMFRSECERSNLEARIGSFLGDRLRSTAPPVHIYRDLRAAGKASGGPCFGKADILDELSDTLDEYLADQEPELHPTEYTQSEVHVKVRLLLEQAVLFCDEDKEIEEIRYLDRLKNETNMSKILTSVLTASGTNEVARALRRRFSSEYFKFVPK